MLLTMPIFKQIVVYKTLSLGLSWIYNYLSLYTVTS